AALHVGAEHEDGLRGVETGVDADQVARRRDHAEKAILEALGEEANGDLLVGVGAIDSLERLRITAALEGVHVRAEAPAVEPVDALRRHERALGLGEIGVGVGEEVGAEHGRVEAQDDGGAGHRDFVLAEAPPHQLPLRGDEDALLLRGGGGAALLDGRARRLQRDVGASHHVSSRRMRGSIQTRRMSETSVPITVITPSSRTIVPARNMSWAISALSRSGPTVGRPSTSDTMMLPETMYGSV